MTRRSGWRLALAFIVLPVACAAADDCPPPMPTLDAPTMQRIASQARDHGFLWRLSKDGRRSHLYGTMHVGRIEWIVPGPQVSEALRGSDLLALEIDVLDPATTTAMVEAMGALAQVASPPGAGDRLQRLAERACQPTLAGGAVPPLVQVLQLTIAEGRREGLEPLAAQEVVLGMAARSLGQPVLSLETVAIQVAALQSMDLERSLEQLEQGRLRPLLRRLASAWESGDFDTLADYARWCECLLDPRDRESFEKLNDQRNPYLAARIDELHGSGRRVFAAIGALHMTGPQALTRLLAERGFRIERVPLR